MSSPASHCGEGAVGDPVRVREIVVRSGRLVCDVVVPLEKHRRTSPRLAAFVTQQCPDLPHHACVNAEGPMFGYVIERTSVPHLLEHVAISFQMRTATSSNACFSGTTEWTDKGRGEARIQLSFQDDLEALRALNEALRLVNNAVITCTL